MHIRLQGYCYLLLVRVRSGFLALFIEIDPTLSISIYLFYVMVGYYFFCINDSDLDLLYIPVRLGLFFLTLVESFLVYSLTVLTMLSSLYRLFSIYIYVEITLFFCRMLSRSRCLCLPYCCCCVNSSQDRSAFIFAACD